MFLWINHQKIKNLRHVFQLIFTRHRNNIPSSNLFLLKFRFYCVKIKKFFCRKYYGGIRAVRLMLVWCTWKFQFYESTFINCASFFTHILLVVLFLRTFSHWIWLFILQNCSLYSQICVDLHFYLFTKKTCSVKQYFNFLLICKKLMFPKGSLK